MKRDERSIGALLMALVALGFIALAFASPWYHFEATTGRTTPPDGPQDADDTGVEHHHLEFYVDHREGTIEPADTARADAAQEAVRVALLVAGLAMGFVIIGEIPFVSLIIVRPVGIVAAAVGLSAILYSLWVAWHEFPAALAGYAVEDPFTARRLEFGYIRTNLLIGWVFAAIAGAAAFSAGIWKFGAGEARPDVVEQYRAAEDA